MEKHIYIEKRLNRDNKNVKLVNERCKQYQCHFECISKASLENIKRKERKIINVQLSDSKPTLCLRVRFFLY